MSYKRARGLSNLADDNILSLLRDDDKAKAIELFKGSRNYWRCRSTIEFTFIYYPMADCIEVLGFENSKALATNSLYVCASTANKKCQTSSNFEEAFADKKREYSRKRMKTLDDNSTVNVLREYICNYLIARIDLVQPPDSPKSVTLPSIHVASPKSGSFSSLMCKSSSADDGDTGDANDVKIGDNGSKSADSDTGFEPTAPSLLLKWVPMSSDVADVPPEKIIGYKLEYVVDSAPDAIRDDQTTVNVPKRVSMHMGDFDKMLTSFRKEQSKLSLANREASRLLNLAQLGAAGFANSYQQRMKREQFFSVAKKRWHWAYRRVRTRAFVASITARLNVIYNNIYPVEGGIAAVTPSTKSTTSPISAPTLNSSQSLPVIPGIQSRNVDTRATIALTKNTPSKNGNPTGAPEKLVLQSAEDPRSATATPRSKLVAALPGMHISEKKKRA